MALSSTKQISMSLFFKASVLVFVWSTLQVLDQCLIVLGQCHPTFVSFHATENALTRSKNGANLHLCPQITACHMGRISSPRSIKRHPTFIYSNGQGKGFVDAISNIALSPQQNRTITEMVNKRGEARAMGDYFLADSIRDDIQNLSWTENHDQSANNPDSSRPLLPPGYKVEIRDIPRKQGGGSTWNLVPIMKDPIERDSDDGTNVLQLAHAALGMATSASEKNRPINFNELDALVKQAEEKILLTGASELRGRKAADAAFWLALAGVLREYKEQSPPRHKKAITIFDSLAHIATEELKRFGKRSSCRPKDIMHIVERIAAAGVRDDSANMLYKVAADCLSAKTGTELKTLSSSTGIIEKLKTGNFGLHSDRSLLLIWRFSTKQRKQRAFLKAAAKHYEHEAGNLTDIVDGLKSPSDVMSYENSYDWEKIFDNQNLPLVVDVGCGMGVSLLGLASIGKNETEISHYNIHMNDIDWHQCNFIGADLSRLAIGYAKSISSRWGIDKRLHFCCDSAENILEQVQKTYPGSVKLIMIQFPTPFRLGAEDAIDCSANQAGNSQLPVNVLDGFMVSPKLLRLAKSAVQPYGDSKLLLQSNCEDVAVYMRRVATEDAGFRSLKMQNWRKSLRDSGGRVPQRTSLWISMGGERAEGENWSSESLIPRLGSTETEVSCLLNGTPIHRCLLTPI